MPNLPRIAVIGTGGTISSLGANSLDVLDYPDFGQKLTCEALLDKFPETRLVAEPVPVTYRQVGSTAIGPTLSLIPQRPTIWRAIAVTWSMSDSAPVVMVP